MTVWKCGRPHPRDHNHILHSISLTIHRWMSNDPWGGLQGRASKVRAHNSGWNINAIIYQAPLFAWTEGLAEWDFTARDDSLACIQADSLSHARTHTTGSPRPADTHAEAPKINTTGFLQQSSVIGNKYCRSEKSPVARAREELQDITAREKRLSSSKCICANGTSYMYTLVHDVQLITACLINWNLVESLPH